MDLELVNNLTKSLDINKETKLFSKSVESIIEKGAVYVLKAMPIQENVRDILIDITKSLKTKKFSNIVQTAVTSSVREGLEFLETPISIIKDVKKVVDISKKGGLREALCSAIDITFNKYIKNNLLSDVIGEYRDDIKSFINSKEFDRQLSKATNLIEMKQQGIMGVIDNWKKCYEDSNINDLKLNFEKLKKSTKIINRVPDLKNEFNFINNVMEFVNNKQYKLTPIQLEFCKNN